MNAWLRRLRGVLGIGLTWAVSWSVIGVGMAVVERFTGLQQLQQPAGHPLKSTS
jgi:hypothetical protein